MDRCLTNVYALYHCFSMHSLSVNGEWGIHTPPCWTPCPGEFGPQFSSHHFPPQGMTTERLLSVLHTEGADKDTTKCPCSWKRPSTRAGKVTQVSLHQAAYGSSVLRALLPTQLAQVLSCTPHTRPLAAMSRWSPLYPLHHQACLLQNVSRTSAPPPGISVPGTDNGMYVVNMRRYNG